MFLQEVNGPVTPLEAGSSGAVYRTACRVCGRTVACYQDEEDELRLTGHKPLRPVAGVNMNSPCPNSDGIITTLV